MIIFDSYGGFITIHKMSLSTGLNLNLQIIWEEDFDALRENKRLRFRESVMVR